DPAAFRAAFEARLHALSHTHDLLTASSWRGAALRDVVLTELSPHGENHYRVEGPAVDLTPPQALTFGMVFHELATNAAKYGALSHENGCVRVAWSLDEAGVLVLTWSENGGPKVTPPKSRGFGSRLIERSVAGDLGGTAQLSFDSEGLTCRIETDLTARPYSR
ncbi:MAG TPA: sensor histidine kinase, partial [Phenylobacterium sp.]|nr:sensor histidine kinase [Phenylobacterium sp.]